jgi:hypothetical protein
VYPTLLPLRLSAHWQLNSCGDKIVAVNVRALATKKLLVLATFVFQYRLDCTERACVCALLLRIRTDRRRKRRWVHPVVGERLLNGQFYILHEDLRNYQGKFFIYFRMSIESFDNFG